RGLEGRDVEDVREYIDNNSEKYRRMVDWIAKDLGVSTLRYQTMDDMVKAIGLPKEKLCLYCWTGQCPGATRPKPLTEILEVKSQPTKRPVDTKVTV
ncbi:unnamed protein product, partial [marine sediment metagenome]